MSGDVQPRKRKKDAAKRKKDSEGDIMTRKFSAKEEDKETTVTGVKNLGQDDQQMHVHKDHGTGGHWCAKIVFFFLLAILAGLVGLIILENRGQSDLDTPLSESRYADILEGWVQEEREVFDEHEVAEALNELDNHEHDNEPFEEEPDLRDDDEEEEEDAHSEEDHQDENDAEQEEDKTVEEEEDDEEDEDREVEETQEVESQEVEEDLVREKRSVDQDNDEEEDEDDGDDEEVDREPEVDAIDDNDSAEEPKSHQVPFEEMSVMDLQSQVDEMKRVYDQLAKDLNHTPFEGLQETTLERMKRSSKSQVEGSDDDDNNDTEEYEDDDNESFEKVVDNDAGEELHLRKLAEQNRESSPAQEDREAGAAEEEGEEPGSSSASQISPPRGDSGQQAAAAHVGEAEMSADEFKRANQFLNNNPGLALRAFEKLLLNHPSSFDALYGRALALDAIAEESGDTLMVLESIDAHEKLILGRGSEMEDHLLEALAATCLDRLKMLGQYKRATGILDVLVKRFPTDPERRVQMAINFLFMDDLPSAKRILHETLMNWRYHGPALTYYAYVLVHLDGAHEEAVSYFAEGNEVSTKDSSDSRIYTTWGEALQRLGRNEEAMEVFRKGAALNLYPSEWQRSLYNVNGLIAKPFWSVEETGVQKALEEFGQKWKIIWNEVKDLFHDEEGHFANEAEKLLHLGDWKQLVLFSRGEKVKQNCLKTPKTCELIEHFPEARSCTRGQVKFSVLTPGTHIWPHCGPTNARLRAHLALKAEKGQTSIRVGEETRHWTEGEWLIFDDSFEHEVWHKGTEARVVLIVDLWHPEVTDFQRKNLPPI